MWMRLEKVDQPGDFCACRRATNTRNHAAMRCERHSVRLALVSGLLKIRPLTRAASRRPLTRAYRDEHLTKPPHELRRIRSLRLQRRVSERRLNPHKVERLKPPRIRSHRADHMRNRFCRIVGELVVVKLLGERRSHFRCKLCHRIILGDGIKKLKTSIPGRPERAILSRGGRLDSVTTALG